MIGMCFRYSWISSILIPTIRTSFHAIMVDNGVLRLNEGETVYQRLNKDLGVNLTLVDASDLFLSRLSGVEDPEQKRKIIGNTFINVFEDEAHKLDASVKGARERRLSGYSRAHFIPMLSRASASKVRALQSKRIIMLEDCSRT